MKIKRITIIGLTLALAGTMTAFAAWQIPVLLGEFALFCAVWALLLNRTARG